MKLMNELRPGTKQYDVMLLLIAFELHTLSMTSEENGCCINMVWFMSMLQLGSKIEKTLQTKHQGQIEGLAFDLYRGYFYIDSF